MDVRTVKSQTQQLEIQCKSVTLNGGTTTFNFDHNVTQFLAGVTSFQLSYGDTDHNVETMSIQLQTGVSDTQVTVGATVELVDDDGHEIDTSNSYVYVSVIAWTGGSNPQVLLSPSYSVANASQGPDGGISIPSPPKILQSVLCGFSLSYGDTDHNVETVQVTVGAENQGNTGYIQATAEMHDDSGNNASSVSANGALIATSLADSGFVIKPYENQDAAMTELDMGTPLTSAISFLTGFQVQYPDSDDHNVETIGAGNSQTGLDPNDNTKVQLFGVQAWMHDDSGNNQDNSQSFARTIVVGIKAPTKR